MKYLWNEAWFRMIAMLLIVVAISFGITCVYYKVTGQTPEWEVKADAYRECNGIYTISSKSVFTEWGETQYLICYQYSYEYDGYTFTESAGHSYTDADTFNSISVGDKWDEANHRVYQEEA